MDELSLKSKRLCHYLGTHPFGSGLFVLLALYFLTRLPLLGNLPIFYDEAIYIRWSQLVREGKFLISLTDGVPPMHTWLMSPLLDVFGDPLLGGRLLSVICGSLTLVLVVLLGKELFDERKGILGGLLYVLCPQAIWYDRIAIIEPLLLTLFVLAIYVSVRAAKSLAWHYVFALGVVLGVSLLTKSTAQLLFVIIPFAYLLRPKGDTGGVGPPAKEKDKEKGFPAKGKAMGESHREEGGEKGKSHPFRRWLAIIFASYFLGFGIYNLLRLSPKFGMISSRTAVATKTLGEVVRNPFDVFFSNVGEIFTALFIFVTPVIFVMGIAGIIWGIRERNRVSYFIGIWMASVWFIEAVISKHWMFETVLPRHYLVIVPSFLFGALEFGELLWKKWIARVQGKGKIFVVTTLVVITLGFPVFNVVKIVAWPQEAILPKWVKFQYLTDWPSGYGIRECVSFLEREASRRHITVGSNMAGIGLPTDALEIYLGKNPNVKIVPFRYESKDVPPALEKASLSEPVYVVYNMFPGVRFFPNDWDVEVISSYPKDGNPKMRMFLLKLNPHGKTRQ
ncbi:MAG: glycosyltransferase family 39 protein [Actinomycetota bacterium]|nr:glycosyltransferase family 39 protein [Actinomycetota bacterium]